MNMAGQWAPYRKKIPAYKLEESQQQKVDAAKLALLGTTKGEGANVKRLSALLAKEDKKKKDHEQKIKELNVNITALSQLIVEVFEDEQLENVHLRNGAVVRLSDGLYPHMKDREKFFAWIKKNKRADLLSVHASTLK